jgi:predicted methyltransferase
MTDPPYTKSGINMFLSKAIDLLGNSRDFSGKYIFLFYGNSFKSPEKFLKIQEIISNRLEFKFRFFL